MARSRLNSLTELEMKLFLALFTTAFLVVGFSPAQEKKAEPAKFDGAKLVGKWELTKSSDKDDPKGATVIFEKDGKVSITADFEGKQEKFSGTYAVKGDKLTVKINPPEGTKGEAQTESDTIKILSDEKLVLLDEKGKETEFTKKK